jgi:hypothetical protein
MPHRRNANSPQFHTTMHHTTILLRLLAAVFLAGSLGCTSGKKDLKAKAAAPSPFLIAPGSMHADRGRAPFNSVWVNPALNAQAANYKSIYIAPVNTQFLRPVDRPLVTVLEGPKAKDRPVDETASLLRSGFTAAFRSSPTSRLKVANGPGPGVLTLQLALIELNPTNVVGNAVKYGAPGGSVVAPMTKGNIAIEGKLTDSSKGTLLYQFADNEQDPFTAVSLRDLSSYGHSRTAIRDWARQFEELMSTPPSHKVKDSSSVSLNPF